MQTRQAQVRSMRSLDQALAPLAAIAPQLALVFASCEMLTAPEFGAALKRCLPGARCIGCSTAGEISREGVENDSAVVTAVRFDHPDFRVAAVPHPGMAASMESGRALAALLDGPGLHALMVFGQGVAINGSALVEGLSSSLDKGVSITGGLAGDNGAFKRTFTMLDGVASCEQIVGIGFYGDHLELSHGCFGGWEPFGAARKVTRADGNILYEIDGQPALDLYERYLGEYARDLPASGLLYPFEMLDSRQSNVGLIRTILGLDEKARSLTLAGDVDANGYLRLMQASTDALVEGARRAATAAHRVDRPDSQGLAVLVSCVGRKLVMGARVDEEVEAVAEVYGAGTAIAGYYSNGEISPLFESTQCQLHNQTMTVTRISER